MFAKKKNKESTLASISLSLCTASLYNKPTRYSSDKSHHGHVNVTDLNIGRAGGW